MLQVLYPNAYVESVFSIDYAKLYDKGYRGILFDIDNTLVHHGENSNKEIDALFQAIHDVGLKTLLLSNNSEERIKRFVANINAPYIHEAQKPKVHNYLKALKVLHIKKEEALCIGDQIFTDIYGANKSGIDNILVAYLRHPNETKIGMRRTVEKLVLALYARHPAYPNKIKDVCQKEIN